MSNMKSVLNEILLCDECEGKGIINAWASPDGEYDFDWCDCNPYRLVIDDGEIY